MKVTEREQVRQLRRQGLSYGRIREIVPVSKSSISLWTRDIELSPEQLTGLESNRARGREKYSETMERRREARDAGISAQAETEYRTLSLQPEFMYGLALYIGEGTKTTRGSLVLSNCDPRVLRKFIRFMELLGVPRMKLRARIQLHPHLLEAHALEFWSGELGIPIHRFGKMSTSLSSASKELKPDKQRYGTCSVYYGSTELWLKIRTWMDTSLA